MSEASHQGFHAEDLDKLRKFYRDGLLEDTIPFWLRHGLDHEYGGLLSGLDRDGSLIDSDKSAWLQGRAAWTFATLFNTVERRDDWLQASRLCLDFLRDHFRSADGKLYFTTTRDGRPLRMRRYSFAECFASMGSAAYAKATGEARAAGEAVAFFERFLHEAVEPGAAPAKVNPATRPMRSLGVPMMTIVTAQELRAALGDRQAAGRSCSEWIDRAVADIERYHYKPDAGVLMETVGRDGEILDHFDGRTLNPGHAIECAWFLLHEAKTRGNDSRLLCLGLAILDCMWERGWDREHGGLLSFTDVHGLPVQEYHAEMKFWWPHNEAVIATLLAWQLTGDSKYAAWHALVHDWSHRVFADPEHGEWFGYATREGRITTRLKGNTFKGPFHLPRMQLYGWRLLEESLAG